MKPLLRVMIIVFSVIGFLAVLDTFIEYNSPEIEVTTSTDVYGTEYTVVEYEFGIMGVKALTGADGEIHVLTCFQKPGAETSRCWSKRVDEVE